MCSSDLETGLKAPDADVFTANSEGRTVQATVPVGNEVTHPSTGKKVKLNTIQDSTEFISSGGALSEVPDEHLVDAIFNNTEQLDFGNAWNFRRNNARFEWIEGGGGMHGQSHFIDRHTGFEFGIKFDHSFDYADEDKPMHIRDMTHYDAPRGIAVESIASTVAEMLGFEPMATRIVGRSVPGSHVSDRDGGMTGQVKEGPAMIVEWAQNRFKNVKDPPVSDVAIRNTEIEPKSTLRMLLLDALLGNTDRNNGNIKIAPQSSGLSVAVPIDQGQSIMAGGMQGNSRDFALNLGLQVDFRQGMTDELWSGIGSMKREDLVPLIAEVMKDYREDVRKKHMAIVRATDDVLAKLKLLKGENAGDMDELDKTTKKAVMNMFKRWEHAVSMSDEEIADTILEAAHYASRSRRRNLGTHVR